MDVQASKAAVSKIASQLDMNLLDAAKVICVWMICKEVGIGINGYIHVYTCTHILACKYMSAYIQHTFPYIHILIHTSVYRHIHPYWVG